MEVLGVMVGTDKANIHKWASDLVQQHKQLCSVLVRGDIPAQIALLILRQCVLPSMHYYARTIPPGLFTAHANEFDALILNTIIDRLRLPSPLPDGALETLTLPIRLGGGGFRPIAPILPTCLLSAIALAAHTICQLIPNDHKPRLLDLGPQQLRFARQVTACCDAVRQLLPDAPPDLVPPTTAHFWQSGTVVCRGLQCGLFHHRDCEHDRWLETGAALKESASWN